MHSKQGIRKFEDEFTTEKLIRNYKAMQPATFHHAVWNKY